MAWDSTYRYQEIAKVLRDEILRGEFDRQGKLPSERMLVDRFQVQRSTIRQALGLLEKEGQIETEGKRGSFLRTTRERVEGKSFLMDVHGGHSPTLARLRDGFIRVANEAGYSLRLFDSHPAHGAALDPIPNPESLDRDIAGVVVWPQNPTNLEALVRLNTAVPIVLVDRRVMGMTVDCVRFDDLAGGRMVTEHLIADGHRRIGFISDDVFAETVQHRWLGYAQAHESNGVPVDPRLSLFLHGIDATYFAASIRFLLSLGSQAPTAIVCSNDVVAFYLMRFLHEEGVRVPDDLAITGYGDSMPEFSDAMALTTIHQPFTEMGGAAAKILIQRVGHSIGQRLGEPYDVVIPVSLVNRGSTSMSRVDTVK